MAWSTSQLAEIAGSTVKTVRHYHKLGLLDEPERTSNGYKQYEVAHLVRLLQITRLADLGVPLARIATMGHAGQDPETALRALDGELAATIERLQRIRGELSGILEHGASADLPAGFGPVTAEMTDTDRSLVMIYSRVYDDTMMSDMREVINGVPRTEVDEEFDNLPPEADRADRRRLAEAMAPGLAELLEKYEWMRDPGARIGKGSPRAEGTIAQAMHALYNPAQLEVLYRAHLISTGAVDDLAELEEAIRDHERTQR